MKILLYNIGYCRGFSGAVLPYLTGFWRFLYNPSRWHSSVADAIYTTIRNEDPDLCVLLEVQHGSPLLSLLSHSFFCDVSVKYGQGSFLSRLPFHRKNCNAFCTKELCNFHKHYLNVGSKKLVYKLQLPNGVDLYAVHLSLKRSTREKQLRELGGLLQSHTSSVLCGDFNIQSLDELGSLRESRGLLLINDAQEHPFPAHHPRRTIDLFLCSTNIGVRSIRTLRGLKESDHLPVLLDLHI